MNRLRLILLPILAACALLAAACGDDGDGPGPRALTLESGDDATDQDGGSASGSGSSAGEIGGSGASGEQDGASLPGDASPADVPAGSDSSGAADAGGASDDADSGAGDSDGDDSPPPASTSAPPADPPAPPGDRVILVVGLSDAEKWGSQITVPDATIIVSGIQAWGVHQDPADQWGSAVPNTLAGAGRSAESVTDVVWTTADWMNGTKESVAEWEPAARSHLAAIRAFAPNATVWVAPNRPVSYAQPGGKFGPDPAAWVAGEWDMMASIVAAESGSWLRMGPFLPDLSWPRDWFAPDGRHWLGQANLQISSAWSAHLG